jgi:hypothetical protein
MWKEARDGKLGRDAVAFHRTIYDNPHISRAYIEEIKKNCTAEVWEQEYMANENAYSGLMYPEFENEHIVKHREPKGPRFARFMDWGMDHPTHILWAEIFHNAEKGRWCLYVFRELQLVNKCAEDVTKAILSGDDRPYVFTVIDSAAKRTEMGTGTSILTEFRRCGLSCIVPTLPGNKDALRVNSLKMMLKNGDVLISENCPILIRQLKEVEWNGTHRQEDDAADALKYGASMVYNRDFTEVKPDFEVAESKIDPHGLLANREPEDSFLWDVVNG